jgi:hypothetical protein
MEIILEVCHALQCITNISYWIHTLVLSWEAS